jgi:hypothetical protein
MVENWNGVGYHADNMAHMRGPVDPNVGSALALIDGKKAEDVRDPVVVLLETIAAQNAMLIETQAQQHQQMLGVINGLGQVIVGLAREKQTADRHAEILAALTPKAPDTTAN